jgi:hypothetical protein
MVFAALDGGLPAAILSDFLTSTVDFFFLVLIHLQ